MPAVVGPPTADEERAKRRAVVENALSPIHVSRALPQARPRTRGDRRCAQYTFVNNSEHIIIYLTILRVYIRR